MNHEYNGSSIVSSLDVASFQSTEWNPQGSSQHGINPRVTRYGLRDKLDASVGLMQTDPETIQKTQVEYTLTADTRDCIGMKSLEDTQIAANNIGIRGFASGTVLGTTGAGVAPIVVTLNDISNLRDGDHLVIKGVTGNTNANGKVVITNLVYTTEPEGTGELQAIGNGTYTGGGDWTREEDKGYPLLLDTMSIISGNRMIVNLNKPLKEVRSISIFHIVIPRDIIPLQYYLADFVPISITYDDIVYEGATETNYTTFIKEEQNYTEERLLGFFSSPLDLFRAYRNGSVSMPDQVTPPPLQLWNPPLGDWPDGQPISYPYQTVPTYVSNTFSVTGETGDFYLILAGYGVYDLLDWSVFTGNPVTDSINTSIMRKLLLLLICPKQSYNNVDYITMILNSSTVTNTVYPYGYGDFQRFVCGPGYQSNYQPATNDAFPANPTESSTESPIPFPNYRGNVCGPYSTAGDRFQKMGVRTLVQDLYLNGDLNNLFGEPVIFPDVPVEGITNHPTFGLNFAGQVEVNLGNIATTTNLNILNAMRITPNGFGAASVRANGNGLFYTNVYQQAGGQGPSNLGPPSAWVDHGVYGEATGSFTDPVAQGPSSSINVVPSTADASYSGITGDTTPQITHREGYFDLGPENGLFVSKVLKYIDFAVNDIPDTDLVIKIEEADRTVRAQSTNSNNSYAMLDVPIRLNIGSSSGTAQYIESLQSLVAVANYYWEQRYYPEMPRMQKLHMTFWTYDNQPIPLEKMLQERSSVILSRLAFRLINNLEYMEPLVVAYLFDPLNPRLLGRVKRYMQIIFKINCYESMAPGLEPTSYNGLPPYTHDTVAPYS